MGATFSQKGGDLLPNMTTRRWLNLLTLNIILMQPSPQVDTAVFRDMDRPLFQADELADVLKQLRTGNSSQLGHFEPHEFPDVLQPYVPPADAGGGEAAELRRVFVSDRVSTHVVDEGVPVINAALKAARVDFGSARTGRTNMVNTAAAAEGGGGLQRSYATRPPTPPLGSRNNPSLTGDHVRHGSACVTGCWAGGCVCVRVYFMRPEI